MEKRQMEQKVKRHRSVVVIVWGRTADEGVYRSSTMKEGSRAALTLPCPQSG